MESLLVVLHTFLCVKKRESFSHICFEWGSSHLSFWFLIWWLRFQSLALFQPIDEHKIILIICRGKIGQPLRKVAKWMNRSLLMGMWRKARRSTKKISLRTVRKMCLAVARVLIMTFLLQRWIKTEWARNHSTWKERAGQTVKLVGWWLQSDVLTTVAAVGAMAKSCSGL